MAVVVNAQDLIIKKLFLKLIRNSVEMEFVHASDSGLWSVRFPTIRSLVGPRPVTSSVWCNFTLVVLEDSGEEDQESADLLAAQESAQNDQPEPVSSEDMNSHYDHQVDFRQVSESGSRDGEFQEDRLANEDSSLPRAPMFKKISSMEEVQTIVRPAGLTITYKCPADGEDHFRKPSRLTLVLLLTNSCLLSSQEIRSRRSCGPRTVGL